jgi:hypothetical protein
MRLNAQAPEDTWLSPGTFTIGDLAAGWAAFPDIAVRNHESSTRSLATSWRIRRF